MGVSVKGCSVAFYANSPKKYQDEEKMDYILFDNLAADECGRANSFACVQAGGTTC
jgi:hypothetical protein